MKKNLILFTLLVALCSFYAPVPNSDSENAMKTIYGFYDAMITFDYKEIGNFCTPDFGVIDDGIYYQNIEDFIGLLKTFEGATFDYKLDVKKTDFNSKTGLIILMFDIDINMNDELMHITAIEDYYLKKEKGKWLIAFIHSTPIKA